MPDCKRVCVEQEDKRRGKKYLQRRPLGLMLNFIKTPRCLIYVSCVLSMWSDRMWHFAISVFLIELCGGNPFLTAVVGLIIAGSVVLLGAIIGDWVDRNPRIKGGLLHGGHRSSRCSKPCKHSFDNCHSQGLDYCDHRMQQKWTCRMSPLFERTEI